MRYGDWDVLLFPRDCKVPFKEFKVDCHIVHDTEFAHSYGSFCLPTVCCFVPGLVPGEPFQISIHSWNPPTFDPITQAYPQYQDNAVFEARVFIDGRLIASTSFGNEKTMQTWPYVIEYSIANSMKGDLEPLRFPTFRSEILEQNYWSPADDIGRIKVTISEGFLQPYTDRSVERIKNLVSFSFQHVPAKILESSGIAWPNERMWQAVRFNSSMTVPTLPSDVPDSHAHSPRKRSKPIKTAKFPMAQDRNWPTNDGPIAHQQLGFAGDLRLGDGIHGRMNHDKKSNTDSSMPDYMSPNTAAVQIFDSDTGEHSDLEQMLNAPTNTPTSRPLVSQDRDLASRIEGVRKKPFEPLTELSDSILNQPSLFHLARHYNGAPPWNKDIGDEVVPAELVNDNMPLRMRPSKDLRLEPDEKLASLHGQQIIDDSDSG
ncbi:hypothetical protein VHEMI09318 [[Torrubiella] hemipterigena]|uniref:Uncharacterized protein n=1 Tax=[Torrubiella] hemipterigena TaxID=1531966 RepID=A0A0A1TQ55_9HYPO|nr:hypothetical protein VHEMI09318 [[Torrubiella] hemipterigena]